MLNMVGERLIAHYMRQFSDVPSPVGGDFAIATGSYAETFNKADRGNPVR